MVFGVPVNLGTAGQISVTGQESFDPITKTGTFTRHFVSSGFNCSSCNAACSCSYAGCPLCMNVAGTYTCPPEGCTSGQEIGSTASVTALSSSLGLPPITTYKYTLDDVRAFVGQSGVEDVFMGDATLNAFTPIPTLTGTNVKVPLSGTGLNIATGEEITIAGEVTYGSVSSPGSTLFEVLGHSPTRLPPNYALAVGRCAAKRSTACQSDADCVDPDTCERYYSRFFELSTTATVGPPITVCINHADTGAGGGNGFVDDTGKPGVPEQSLRILHVENGEFVDVTLAGYPDSATNSVCGQVSSLSLFGIAVLSDIPGGGVKQSDCISEWSVQRSSQGVAGGLGGTIFLSGASGVPGTTLVCRDGDRECDAGSAAGECTFQIGICPNRTDSRIGCQPNGAIKQYALRYPRLGRNAIDDTIVQNIMAAMLFFPGGNASDTAVTFDPPMSGVDCLQNVNITVPLSNGARRATKALRLEAQTTTGVRDADKLTLRCYAE